MSANIHVKHSDEMTHGSGVWHRLRAEREEICDVLLKEPAPGLMSGTGQANATEWHRELLQARLRKIDDALDRLMAGSYGNCSKCGRWIEDTKLDFDPAIAYCIECWPRVQTVH